ncbi:hypothetical protein [Alteribacter keqinensis]|uniref:Uncharacterized protein n=1 Tax=Alteribacter keqinensis TaxID=2483800 RepID=A0A3M7TXI7_9BACI|nr:hypothetical protein [Alteribacter keqinensis]RNA69612.1 hypothetical protein EBO34_06650 [Alteribacter keqinensis]
MNVAWVQQTFESMVRVEKSGLRLGKGQILQGTVKQLYPNNLATIQYGSIPVNARLEVGLVRDRTYWFEVASTGGIPKLKVLNSSQSATSQALPGSSEALVNEWRLQKSGVEDKLLRMFTASGVPFSRSHIIEGASLFHNSPYPEKTTVHTLSHMAQNQLPFTKETFMSLAVLDGGGSTGHSLEQLLTALKGQPEHASLVQSLEKAFTGMSESNGRPIFPPPLHTFLSSLGLLYERNLQQKGAGGETAENLKARLLQFLGEKGITEEQRGLARSLVHRLTGMQLLNIDNNHSLHHHLFYIPVKFGDLTQNVTIQWEGRKNEEGGWDSNHCRILFYLELEGLKETIADVHIQQRIVTLTLFNQFPEPVTALEKFKPLLEAALLKGDYRLSSVHWKQPDDHNRETKRTIPQKKGFHKGIDIRV